MSHIETMRLALKALEVYWAKAEHRRTREDERQAEDAITAIKSALEAKDEPVVWNEGVPAMLPKQKEGETFIVSYEPKLEAKDKPWECVCGANLYIDANGIPRSKASVEPATVMFKPELEAKDEPVAGQPLPCPFCGHVGLNFADGETYRWGVASCGGCGASCGDIRREYPDLGEWHTEAIAEWNRRSPAPQRTWVGLTPEEEEEIITKAHSGAGWRFYIRETEQKLKERNTWTT